MILSLKHIFMQLFVTECHGLVGDSLARFRAVLFRDLGTHLGARKCALSL